MDSFVNDACKLTLVFTSIYIISLQRQVLDSVDVHIVAVFSRVLVVARDEVLQVESPHTSFPHTDEVAWCIGARFARRALRA